MITFSVPKDMLLYSHEMGTPSDFSVRGFSGGQGEDGSSMTVTVSAVAAELWTPAAIPGALWFDPANANFRTLSGSSISALRDVIGGTQTITQATSSAMPTLVTGGLNGLDVASFDGGDSLTGTISAPGSNPISMFAVWLTTDSAIDVMLMLGAATTNAGFGLGRNPTTGGYNTFVWNGPEKSIAGTYSRFVMELAQRNASGIRVGLDGVLSAYATISLNIATGTLNVGRTAQPGGYVNGKMAAFVIGIFDDDMVQRLFGWAAHTYGLTANLPVDHPYKLVPPTI